MIYVLVFCKYTGSPRQTFLSWQTSLLCIVVELAGEDLLLWLWLWLFNDFVVSCYYLHTSKDSVVSRKQWKICPICFFICAIVCTLKIGYVVSGAKRRRKYKERKNINSAYCDLGWFLLILVELGISWMNLLIYLDFLIVFFLILVYPCGCGLSCLILGKLG